MNDSLKVNSKTSVLEHKRKHNNLVDFLSNFTKKYEVSNISELSDSLLNSLKVGDVVQKKTGNQIHCYIVTYKEENKGICLSYFDGSGYIETISYDYNGGHWVYNSKDAFQGTSVAQVKDLIEADKDVISKIEVEYNSGYTTFIFPKGILPLNIALNSHSIYFINGHSVNHNGEALLNYSVDEISADEGQVSIVFVGDKSDEVINSILYLNFENDYDSSILFNSYYICFPKASVTKLYKHTIVDYADGYNFVAILPVAEPLNFSQLDSYLKIYQFFQSNGIVSFTENGCPVLFDNINNIFYATFINSGGMLDSNDRADWDLEETTDTVTAL